MSGIKYIIMVATVELSMDRVPTRTGKPGRMGRHFPVREKVREF